MFRNLHSRAARQMNPLCSRVPCQPWLSFTYFQNAPIGEWIKHIFMIQPPASGNRFIPGNSGRAKDEVANSSSCLHLAGCPGSLRSEITTKWGAHISLLRCGIARIHPAQRATPYWLLATPCITSACAAFSCFALCAFSSAPSVSGVTALWCT